MRTLHPVQVPATFRLVLGTDTSVLWGVHSSGEENTYLVMQG